MQTDTNVITVRTIDIETLGTGPKALVTQIAIAGVDLRLDLDAPPGFDRIRVEPKTNTLDYWVWSGLTKNFPLAEQLMQDYVRGSTVEFHMQVLSDDLVQKAKSFDNPVSLLIAHSLAASGAYLACQNSEFDLGILNYWWQTSGTNSPNNSWYDFRRTIDIRGLQNIGVYPQKIPKTHTAVGDAKVELDLLVNAIIKNNWTNLWSKK